jgi:hypothetical protein
MTNDRGPSLVGWLDSACRYNRFCHALAALVSPVQNIFLAAHFFTLLVPTAQQPGQAGVLGRLSLCFWSLSPNTHFLFNRFPSLARTFFILTFLLLFCVYRTICFLRSRVEIVNELSQYDTSQYSTVPTYLKINTLSQFFPSEYNAGTRCIVTVSC